MKGMASRIGIGLGLCIPALAIVLADGLVLGRMKVLGCDGGGVLWGLFIAVLTVIGGREFFRFARRGGWRPAPAVAIPAALLIALGPVLGKWVTWIEAAGPGGLLAGGLLVLFLWHVLAGRSEGAMGGLAVGALFMCYVGVLASFTVRLGVQWGTWVLLMVLTVVKGADAGAYFVGSALGRHKLAPRLSPAKSWEGLAGAIATGMAISVAFASVPRIMRGWELWEAATFGASLALAGVLGDLVESLLKRDVQVKDASDWVPNFGGVLDVVDSPLVAGPVACLLLTLFKIH